MSRLDLAAVPTCLLQVEQVTCAYGGFKAVDSVSFSVQPHEMLGIAGTNGAGKSTLFAAIAGQQRVQAGKIFFDGKFFS